VTGHADQWPLPGLPRVDVTRPASLEELVGHVADGRVPLAGGTDLLVRLSHGGAAAPPLVWTGGVSELAAITLTMHGLRIGAGATHQRVVSDARVVVAAPALVDACGVVGSVQIRSVATVAGNVCNASPAADAVPALVVHAATATLLNSARQRRVVDVEAFATAPGRTTLAPHELLQAVTLRPLGPGSGSAYRRFTARASMDLAFVGVAARVTLDDAGCISDAAVALGAVGPTVIVARAAAAALLGQPAIEASFAVAAGIAADEARPITDLRASGEYRRRIVAVLTVDAITTAVRRARG
jgi:CO/xanthine dehydrogenase FAD-binding subunit